MTICDKEKEIYDQVTVHKNKQGNWNHLSFLISLTTVNNVVMSMHTK